MATEESERSAGVCQYLSDAIQALERLSVSRAGNSNPDASDWLSKESRSIRERLQDAKQRIENCGIENSIGLNDLLVPTARQPLPEESNEILRLLEKAKKLSESERNRLVELAEAACPKNARLLFACLTRCPWHAVIAFPSYRLICIYAQSPRHLFSPASPHERAANGVQEFLAPNVEAEATANGASGARLVLVEVTHFCMHVTRPLWAELLFQPAEHHLKTDPIWSRLLDHPDTPSHLLQGSLPLRRICLGQSLGNITEKRKSGKPVRLRRDVTSAEICAAIRLLSHVAHSLAGRMPSLVEPPDTTDVPEPVLAGWRRLSCRYDADQSEYVAFSDALIAWRDTLAAACDAAEEAETKASTMKVKSRGHLLSRRSAETEAYISAWRSTCLLSDLDRDKFHPPEPTPDIAAAAGLPAGLLPAGLATPNWRLELAACAGSRMYGLNTPTSDVDYLLVYSRVDELAKLRHPADAAECRGPDKAVEFGSCEAGEFARQLLRGSVVQLELLFAGSEARLFESPAFGWLMERRGQFVTENFIRQLMGLAGRLVKRLAEGQSQTPEDPNEWRKLGKAAYQLEHKLDLLWDLCLAREPQVTLSGPERDRVMAIRMADWTVPEIRERLTRSVLDRHRQVRHDLAARQRRLPENCPIGMLTEWLKIVRGFRDSGDNNDKEL